MIDIGIGKEKIFGDLAQLRVGEETNFGLFCLCRLIKVGGMEQGLRQIFRQLPGRQRVIVALEQFTAPDMVVGKIFLHHHRQFRIVMQHFYRMSWAKTAVDQQSFRFDPCPIQGQWPGFAHAAYIRQRLFNDHPANAVTIADLEHQVQIAVTNLVSAYQRLWIG
ncbi:hypothetical protein D3C78_1178600 [compost metagenome]